MTNGLWSVQVLKCRRQVGWTAKQDSLLWVFLSDEEILSRQRRKADRELPVGRHLPEADVSGRYPSISACSPGGLSPFNLLWSWLLITPSTLAVVFWLIPHTFLWDPFFSESLFFAVVGGAGPCPDLATSY